MGRRGAYGPRRGDDGNIGFRGRRVHCLRFLFSPSSFLRKIVEEDDRRFARLERAAPSFLSLSHSHPFSFSSFPHFFLALTREILIMGSFGEHLVVTHGDMRTLYNDRRQAEERKASRSGEKRKEKELAA